MTLSAKRRMREEENGYGETGGGEGKKGAEPNLRAERKLGVERGRV